MGIFTKAFIHVTPAKGRKSEYTKFLRNCENSVTPAINKYADWYMGGEIDGGDEPDFSTDGSYFAVITKRIAEGCQYQAVGEFVEYLTDKYLVNIDAVYADEYEETCGLWRVNVFKEDENYYNKTQDHYAPKDDKQRHEMFLMAWNGYRCPHRNDENFFNQNGIDDEYFYIKEEGEEDGVGYPPIIDDWVNQFVQDSESMESI